MAVAAATLMASVGIPFVVLGVWARGPRQAVRVAAAMALIIVAGWPVDAGASGPPWLEWSAPPECPQSTDIEQRVSEWVGVPLPAEGELFVRATLAGSTDQWDVAVLVSRDGQTAERRVVVSSCAAAADFVAIVVALAVDPTVAERLENDGPVELPTASSPRGVAPTPPSSQSSPASRPDASGRAAQASPPSGGSESEGVPSSVRSGDEPRQVPWRAHLTLWGEDAWGTLPSPTAGLGVGAAADHGRWSVGLGGRWLAPVTESPERAVAPIEFSLVAARGTVEYRLLGPRVQVGPVLSVEGGTVRAHQQVATKDRIGEPWWAFGMGAAVVVELSDRVGLTGQLELTVPVTRPNFVLNDGSEVYRVGPGGRGLLGGRFFFDSR